MPNKEHHPKAKHGKEQRLLNLRSLRDAELNRVMTFFPQKARILELGAGAGWQAAALRKKGHHVFAVDLNTNNHQDHSIFPVIPYDGHNLPFRRDSFDVVFSSNVLEHIQHLDRFEEEIQRVLKPHGTAIHILPTGSWRFWTSITHPAWVFRRIFEIVMQQTKTPNTSLRHNISANARWYHTIFPNRHGERGNSLTELYHFSRYAWRRHFVRHGWQLQKADPLRIFYTGNQILHNHLSLHLRSLLANFLGSSSCVYICTIAIQSPSKKKHDLTT
ncbi:MAG: class I SAM-dependent methyltransferase [Candidatus Thiodiazotropha sp. (ex Dulcina madagascariensis)]|nr:class I SAM-dependent methyltransferase [Candidatus Thiodiazotropha sp. (ex Dulcina madagascariensis)]